ncbi:sigma-70 family RNA polymerase sigma factor [Sphingomonas corticis]|uniref:RNA polymerase sigma factor n=1 Tax=Sphingomonas corticis TaxID=2722791 RepID=A0ABX1CSL4_9SPHN|nr:sigma-70 family RNA polymerase sigma factor [Sphingomonas corticis]NJR79402.1 sigma-70 family RNA polymerase sigma factor [Sphingomonas corticis]
MAEESPQAADEDASTRRQRLAAALVATGLADKSAFARVYRMSSAKLYGVCLRICGERQAAEDVLQEVYLIVWRRASSFDPLRSSPITWLATIARNRAIDWRRAHDRPPPAAVGDDAAFDGDRPDPAPAADDAMIVDEEADRLRRCLTLLGERPRRAISTAFLDGLTYSEVAQREGVPLATMKSTVRRALLELRKCMRHDA